MSEELQGSPLISGSHRFNGGRASVDSFDCPAGNRECMQLGSVIREPGFEKNVSLGNDQVRRMERETPASELSEEGVSLEMVAISGIGEGVIGRCIYEDRHDRRTWRAAWYHRRLAA